MNCEEIASRFLVEGGASKWTPEHVEQIVTAMAADARYHVFAWQEPFVGRDAIREELLRQAALFSPDGACEILNVASVGQTVFVERIDRVIMNAAHLGLHVVGVLDVDVDGKIASWRDYVDSGEIAIKIRPRSAQQT